MSKKPTQRRKARICFVSTQGKMRDATAKEEKEMMRAIDGFNPWFKTEPFKLINKAT